MINHPQLKTIFDRARSHHGPDTEQALETVPNTTFKCTDAAALETMAKCIMYAGFSWKVVDKKWPQIRELLEQFVPEALLVKPPQWWDELLTDKRMIRNHQKLEAIYHNAGFVMEMSDKYGSFSDFMASYRPDGLVDLWIALRKKGARLGGMTGPLCLRFTGYDTWLPTNDVALALCSVGVLEKPRLKSQTELRLAHAAILQWQQSSGLSFQSISRICAQSTGPR